MAALDPTEKKRLIERLSSIREVVFGMQDGILTTAGVLAGLSGAVAIHRQVILAAMSSNIRPKWTIVVDPDIDVHNSADVEWAMAFRVQPQQDVIVIDRIPSGPSDPSIDDPAKPRLMRTASAIGVDATRPFGKPFSEVADVPGWEDFEVPELDRWR